MYVPNLGATFTNADADESMEYTVTDTPGFSATETDTVTLEREDGEVSTVYVDHFGGRNSGWKKVSDAPEDHGDACECDDPIVDYDARVDGEWCDCGEDGGHYHCQRCGGVQ